MAININRLTRYRLVEACNMVYVNDDVISWLEKNVGGPHKYRPTFAFGHCRFFKYSGPGWKILPPDLGKQYYRLEIKDDSLALQFKLTWS